jgi:hypothetical protein
MKLTGPMKHQECWLVDVQASIVVMAILVCGMAHVVKNKTTVTAYYFELTCHGMRISVQCVYHFY